MIRPVQTWVLFGLCVVLAASAMGYVSWTALRLERTESEIRRQSEFEENIRLALWRMDSKLAPLIAQESGRPYYLYSAFYPIEQCYNCVLGQGKQGSTQLPSPLLWFSSPQILIHFQIDPAGTLTSPELPDSTMKRMAAERGFVLPSRETELARLPELRSMVRRDDLLAACVPDPPRLDQSQFQVIQAQIAEQLTRPNGPPPSQIARQQSQQQTRSPEPQLQQVDQQQEAPNQAPMQPAPQNSSWLVDNDIAQQRKSTHELSRRAEFYGNYQSAANTTNAQALLDSGTPVIEGLFKPLWAGELLILARRVQTGQGEYVQGCLLNWTLIRRELLAETADLLPRADFRAVSLNGPAAPSPRLLAALPVELIPGAIPQSLMNVPSPIRLSLLIAWACVLTAAVAVAALLVGAVTLSERRGSFVSAVTHELRTPLTTLRMYTEMLAEGMVPDEAKRRSYLQTLRAEADRLGHLVENVLAYSRIERGRARGQTVTASLGELIERARGRLNERAAQAGMELVVESEPAAGRPVRADPSAVEQILFNLVDNACKYAANGNDRIIRMGVESANGQACIHVRDHGPGIQPREGRRLFRPFSKSAREAANSAPGVGLGLALSRRLAREMGGELSLQSVEGPGACFRLTLPFAT